MPEGGDAVALLKEIASDLSTWGGHRLAAGFSVDVDRWPHVRQRIETLMQEVNYPPEIGTSIMGTRAFEHGDVERSGEH